MSGVYGAIDGRNPDRVPELVGKMGASLRHHSWHVSDDVCDARLGAGLGRVRGGVFNAAPQPLRSDDGRFTLCFAGELYDSDALHAPLVEGGRLPADADDSVLVLELYRDFGVDTPARLDGIFSFAIWDAERGELFLAADRFGSYPLSALTPFALASPSNGAPRRDRERELPRLERSTGPAGWS